MQRPEERIEEGGGRGGGLLSRSELLSFSVVQDWERAADRLGGGARGWKLNRQL